MWYYSKYSYLIVYTSLTNLSLPSNAFVQCSFLCWRVCLVLSTDTKLDKFQLSLTCLADFFDWNFAVLISLHIILCWSFKGQPYLGQSKTLPVSWKFEFLCSNSWPPTLSLSRFLWKFLPWFEARIQCKNFLIYVKRNQYSYEKIFSY